MLQLAPSVNRAHFDPDAVAPHSTHPIVARYCSTHLYTVGKASIARQNRDWIVIFAPALQFKVSRRFYCLFGKYTAWMTQPTGALTGISEVPGVPKSRKLPGSITGVFPGNFRVSPGYPLPVMHHAITGLTPCYYTGPFPGCSRVTLGLPSGYSHQAVSA